MHTDAATIAKTLVVLEARDLSCPTITTANYCKGIGVAKAAEHLFFWSKFLRIFQK